MTSSEKRDLRFELFLFINTNIEMLCRTYNYNKGIAAIVIICFFVLSMALILCHKYQYLTRVTLPCQSYLASLSSSSKSFPHVDIELGQQPSNLRPILTTVRRRETGTKPKKAVRWMFDVDNVDDQTTHKPEIPFGYCQILGPDLVTYYKKL